MNNVQQMIVILVVVGMICITSIVMTNIKYKSFYYDYEECECISK